MNDGQKDERKSINQETRYKNKENNEKEKKGQDQRMLVQVCSKKQNTAGSNHSTWAAYVFVVVHPL